MILGLLVTLVALVAPVDQSSEAKYFSYLNGEKWEFRVTDIDLASVPGWRVTDEAPPLAPRAAIKSGREMLERLLADGAKWEFERVSLQPIRRVPDAWVYLVDFVSPLQPLPSGLVGSAIRSHVTLPVLMDGSAVTPVRSAYSR